MLQISSNVKAVSLYGVDSVLVIDESPLFGFDSQLDTERCASRGQQECAETAEWT